MSSPNWDFSRRGVTLGDVIDLFLDKCGSIYYQEDDDSLEGPPKPVCKPYKLAKMVAQQNVAKQKANDGSQPVQFLRTDLYAVNELIIKPTTEGPPGVSMSEHWHPEGLTVKCFISHYWGEDFGEFVQSLFRFALMDMNDSSLSQEALRERARTLQLYICAFSNNQHRIGEELSDCIEETPFYMALSSPTTSKVVLNLDNQITALQRAWCVFEFSLTIRQEKDFFLNTYLGPLSGLALESPEEVQWLEHMFEMLDIVDLRDAQASLEKDKDIIFKHVSDSGLDGLSGFEVLHLSLKKRISTAVLPMLAKAGQLEQVQRALKNGAEVNQRDSLYLTALTYAEANLTDCLEISGGPPLLSRMSMMRVISSEVWEMQSTAELSILRTLAIKNGAIVASLLDAKADPIHQELAQELVQMFAKSNRKVRVASMAKVRNYIQNTSEKKYHAKALALAELLDEKQEAAVQVRQVENPDTVFKAEALDNLAETGRAALSHVPSIVACLDDADIDVRRSAVRALHRLGPNASHEAVPHLMKFLPHNGEQPCEDGDRDPAQVLQVLHNFAVAPPREFEGQLHSATCKHFGKPVFRGYDSRFNVRQRLLPVPPSWDWGCRDDFLREPYNGSDADKPALKRKESVYTGLNMDYLLVSEHSLGLDEVALFRSCEVQHLALDLRHCPGQQIPKLDAALDFVHVAKQTLVVDLNFCDWVHCAHLHTMLRQESLQRLSVLYLAAPGVNGLDDKTLLALAHALPSQSQMTSLTLDLGNYTGSVIFTDAGVLKFADSLRERIQGWSQLTYLAVSLASGAKKVSAVALAPLLDLHATALEGLFLGLPASRAVTDAFFADAQQALSRAIRLPESLQSLSFDFGASKRITCPGVQTLISALQEHVEGGRLPNLRNIGMSFSAAEGLTGATIAQFASLLEKIRTPPTKFALDISSADLTDEGFLLLAPRLGSNLEVLSIHARSSGKLTWDSMEALGKTIGRCSASLTHLALDFASFGAHHQFNYDGTDIHALLPRLGREPGTGFEKLCHLQLNFSQCASCTDQVIKSTCDILPRSLLLLDLDFSYNSRLTDESLVKLGGQLHDLPRLQHMRINFMAADTVADTGVVKLAEGVQQLQWLENFTLNLHTARNLTMEGVRALAVAFENTPHLEVLVLDLFHSTKCTQVVQLGTSLAKLEFLASMTVHIAGKTATKPEDLYVEEVRDFRTLLAMKMVHWFEDFLCRFCVVRPGRDWHLRSRETRDLSASPRTPSSLVDTFESSRTL